jgi:hypothetical protein
MNIEEARRAAIRREEDLAWLRVVQHAERDRVEINRKAQRRGEEKRRETEKALRDAQYDYSVAKAEHDQRIQREQELKKIEEREARQQKERESLRAMRERHAREQRRRQEEEARIAEAELDHERKVMMAREQERQRKHRTEQTYHSAQSMRHRSPSSVSSNARSTSMKSPTASPTRSRSGDEERQREEGSIRRIKSRVIESEEELARRAAEASLKERRLRELKQLENILAQRQARQQQLAQLEEHNAEVETLAQMKERELAEAALRARENHYRHLERNRKIQLRDRRRQRELEKVKRNVLPPLEARAQTTSPTVTYFEHERAKQAEDDIALRKRLLKAREEQEKHEQLLAEAAEKQRRKEEEKRLQREQEEALLRQKQQQCLEHKRQMELEQRRELDKRLHDEMITSLAFRDAQREEQESFVSELKQREHEHQLWVKHKKDQRALLTQLKAAEARKEMMSLRQLVAQRAAEKKMLNLEASEELAKNRKKAAEKMRLLELRRKEEAEVLRAKEDQRRKEALEQQERDRAKAIEDKAMYLEIRRRNVERQREQEREERLEKLRANESFYSTERKRREGVPSQLSSRREAEEIVLPPHPELISLEEDTRKFMDAIMKDLQEVDRRSRSLPRRI